MYKQWSLSSCKDERFINLQWAFLPQCHLNIQSYLSFKQWLQVWHTSLLKYFRLTIWFNKRSLTETHCGRAGKRPRGTSGLDPPVWRLPAANARRILTLRDDVMKARIWIFPGWGARINCFCGRGGRGGYYNVFEPYYDLMYPGNLNRW